MEDNEKEIIERHLPKLLKFTKCTAEFLALLEADGILSDSDVQEISCCQTPDDQSYRLYKVVVTRTNAFSKLLKALRDTCQTGAYNLLKNDKTQNLSGFFSVPPLGLTDALESKICQIVAIFTPNTILTIQKIEDTSKVNILYDTSVLPILQNDALSWNLPIVLDAQNLEIPKELTCLKQKIICVIRADISELDKFIGDLDHVKCLQDKIEWSDLSENGKANILERKVLNGELEVSLNAIQCLWQCDNFLNKFLKDDLLTDLLFDKQPELFDTKIPPKPVVYLDRVLISRGRLLKSILQWESVQDIFAVSGIPEPQLRPFLRKTIRKSGELLIKNKKLVGIKNVLLEYETDFLKITKLKGSNHIHWLHYINGSFQWITSTGNLQIVQKFISSPENQNRLEESHFPNPDNPEFQTHRPNHPVIVSGLPGIGKSLLLENLARHVRAHSQHKLIIFSKVSGFVNLLQKQITKKTHSENIIHECLSACSMPKYEFSKQLITTLIHSSELKIELMLDGYDEETQDNRELLSKYMKVITEKFQSIRIWITTRPHYLNELEITLNAIGYNILELDSQLQGQLLVKHWAQKENLDIPKLEAFASIYVSGLPAQMRAKSQTLIGIPLQCAILAEILGEWAERYSKSGNQLVPNNELPDLQINSITDLLKMLVETKWKILDSDANSSSKRKMKKEDMINMHIYQAIKLIFPEQEPHCKHLVNNNSVTTEDILRFGLMQKSKQHENLEFITYSVAEYLLALFCTDLLLNESTSEDKGHQQILTDIVFNFTFDQHPTDSARFKHGNIAFYVSSLLEDCKLPTNLAPFMEQHKVQHIAKACVYLMNGINFIQFLFSSGILGTERICSIFDDNILYAAVRNNDEIATFCIQLYKEQKNVKISELKFEESGLSLLQLCAKFNPGMIGSLINEDFGESFKKDSDTSRCLIHALVQDSEFTSEAQLKVKKEELESLHNLKPQMIHEENDEGEPPLFCKNIHISLLKMLIEFGSPVYNQRNTDTVLHRAARYLTPAQYEELILSIPKEDLEKILKTENRNKSTALHILVENLVPNQRTLETFSDNEADFNAKDASGVSILRLAIQNQASYGMIHLLIFYGSNWEEVSADGVSLLHVAGTVGNFDAMDILKHFGVSVNIRDNQGNSPLHAALLQHKNPSEAYLHLVGLGVDVHLRNSIGLNAFENVIQLNNILSHSIPIDVIYIVLTRGTNLSEKQKEALMDYLTLICGSAESANNYFAINYKRAAIDSGDSSHDFTNILAAISQRTPQPVIQDLCDKFTTQNIVPLSETYGAFWEVEDLSALHVAVRVGNLEIMHYLFDCQEFKEELENPKMSNLLRFCISGSAANDDNIVKAKIKILTHFAKFYPTIFKLENPVPLILVGNMHLDILKHLINLGADINSVNYQGQNLLHTSSAYLEAKDYHELIMYILNNKLDYKDFKLTTNPGSNCFTLESTDISPPIRSVIKVEHFENEKQRNFVKKLISLEKYEWNEELLDASESGIVLELNENGVNMTAHGSNYAHELIIVLQKLKDTTQLRSLFQCKDKGNTTSLCSAALRLELEMETIILFLIFGVSLNEADDSGQTPLISSIEGGAHSDFIKRLVLLGADPFKEIFYRTTILHSAAFHGNVSAVEFCIFAGLSVNDVDDHGRAPLHLAFRRSNPETLAVIKRLVASGAELNKVDNDGHTPLHYAVMKTRKGEAEHIQLEAVKYMIKNGANPLITNSYKNTFLHIALQLVTPEQYHDLVDHLIKSKHDQTLFATNNKQFTTLHFAVKFLEPLESTLKLYKIRKYDFNFLDRFGQSILLYATSNGRSIGFLKSLIQLGADLKIVSNNKTNILHACAIGGNFEAAEYFISLGFTDIDAPNMRGNTPLHLACFGDSDNRIQMVTTLLQHGANVNQENEDKICPLLVILRRHEKKAENAKLSDEDFHLIKLLIENGADVTKKDQEGKPLIFLMTKHLKQDDFHELLEYLVNHGRGQVLHQRGPCGETILHRAVEDFDIREDTLKLLLKFGDFDLNSEDSNGNTVVDYASLAGRPQNVELVTIELHKLKVPTCPQTIENGKPVTDA